MKIQPKSTRDKVTMEEVNNTLYALLGAVGAVVNFTYKGNRKVKGILLRPISEGILLKLQSDYISNDEWYCGDKKYFENRTVYNYNCT